MYCERSLLPKIQNCMDVKSHKFEDSEPPSLHFFSLKVDDELLCYLASIWTTELCIRFCDICKDFRLEIRAIQIKTFQQVIKRTNFTTKKEGSFLSLQITIIIPNALP